MLRGGGQRVWHVCNAPVTSTTTTVMVRLSVELLHRASEGGVQ